jgi:glutamyl-tRNA synthetase
MTRVRFAPSPTGSLHVGNALSAVANRRFGDWMLLRIDDTDPARNVSGGEEAILADLEWLGVRWDEGPSRQSERMDRYREAAAELPERFDGITLLREDGTATYHLASVVDDADFEITHVLRGNDHRPNEHLHRRLHGALGTTPPEYVHHGLILGPDGKKLSKRAEGATVGSRRPTTCTTTCPGSAVFRRTRSPAWTTPSSPSFSAFLCRWLPRCAAPGT